jgi:hypothetical protein
MGFLRRLFGGGGGATGADAWALTYYVRPKRCHEILPVRVDLRNDLSLTDDGGYFVRKVVRGERCPFPAELHLSFDANRKLTQVGVQDGETIEEAVYHEWLAKRKDE